MQDPTKDKNMAVVALNGIPRGACSDFNVEEGWVQYLTPKSGDWESVEVEPGVWALDPNIEFEMRRYYGKVEVLGYIDLDGPDDQLWKFYKDLPEDTPMRPTEKYEVVG
jgi:hypothetical protein